MIWPSFPFWDGGFFFAVLLPCEDSVRKRSKTMVFLRTPEEHKLICDMAAWSGMGRQDYIIIKLTDTQVRSENLRCSPVSLFED